MARILDTDGVFITANIIFTEFEIHQSCCVQGWDSDAASNGKAVPKGELVLKELERLDMLENTDMRNDGRRRRKRKIIENTIGGYVAQKIFGFKTIFDNSNPKVTIWRIQ